jgi:hypothetical protein
MLDIDLGLPRRRSILGRRASIWMFLQLALLSLLAAGCGNSAKYGPDDIAPDGSAGIASVGPQGGTFTLAGVAIDVPRGAVDHELSISVTRDRRSPDGFVINGFVYRFAPAGHHFAAPITISFPTGVTGESVFWTVEGQEDRFEKRDTTIERGTAIARVSHFSRGFVGAVDGLVQDASTDASGGVTCTVKRRVVVAGDGSCSQSVTVEQDVKFWLVSYSRAPDDLEAALATDSSGINFFNATPAGGAVCFTKDSTHTRYEGYDGGSGPNSVGLRTGSVLTFTMDAARGGTPPPECQIAALIEVHCSGTTTLLPGPPPIVRDAGAEAMPDVASDVSMPDSASDASDAEAGDAFTPDTSPPDASGGVTCTVKRRVVADGSCSQSVTVEQDVKFWLVSYSRAPDDLEAALATDSSGINFFNATPAGGAVCFTKDSTHTRYEGYDGGSGPNSVGLRTGSVLTFTMDAARGGTPPPECQILALIEVHCSGTTTLLPGPPL